jgi:hypothetical protein
MRGIDPRMARTGSGEGRGIRGAQTPQERLGLLVLELEARARRPRADLAAR